MEHRNVVVIAAKVEYLYLRILFMILTKYKRKNELHTCSKRKK